MFEIAVEIVDELLIIAANASTAELIVVGLIVGIFISIFK